MRVRAVLFAVAVFGTIVLSPSSAVALAGPAVEVVDDEEADSLFTLAGRLYAEQRFEEAIPVFRRVIEIVPRHGNAYALLGGSYFQLGDYANAIRAFERSLELDEGIKLSYLGLVAANYLSDRIGDARAWAERMVPILTGDERERYLATITRQFPLLDLET